MKELFRGKGGWKKNRIILLAVIVAFVLIMTVLAQSFDPTVAHRFGGTTLPVVASN